MSERLVLAFAFAGLVAGVALALAVNSATDEVYRATAALQAVPPTPTAGATDAEPEVQAATYAEIANSRGFLAERDLPAARVDARHLDGTDLVEIVARGGTPAEARTLAAEVATALVAHAEDAGRQRAARIEAELRPRIEQLTAAIAELESTTGSLRSPATSDRLRALRTERAAFQARLAAGAVRAAEERGALVPVAPASAGENPTRPRRALNLFGGVLLGLVAGLGTSLLWRRREGEPVADVPAEPAMSPRVSADQHAGQVVLEALAPGAASLELLVSDGSADWRPIATAEGESARVEWDASGLDPGAYWVCVVARDESGAPTAGEPVPVEVLPSETPARALGL